MKMKMIRNNFFPIRNFLQKQKENSAFSCKAFLVREENFEIYKVMQIQQFSPAN
jgi:hypothetical protein